jgi:hypothetical protein
MCVRWAKDQLLEMAARPVIQLGVESRPVNEVYRYRRLIAGDPKHLDLVNVDVLVVYSSKPGARHLSFLLFNSSRPDPAVLQVFEPIAVAI